MKSLSNRGKITFDWRAALKSPTALDWLLLACVLTAIGVGIGTLVGPITEQSVAQDGALKFAAVVREARDYARANHRPVELAVRPALDKTASTYSIRDPNSTISSATMQPGVSGSGDLAIDGEGSPMSPATFVFRKGMYTVRLKVDDKGNISFPQ